MLMPGPDFPKALTFGLLVSLTLFIALLLINEPLQTGAAPKGIVSFQMAGTLDHATTILASWTATQSPLPGPLCGWILYLSRPIP